MPRPEGIRGWWCSSINGACSHRLFSRFGAPDRIRTCGLYLRRVALYPAELRVPVTWNYSPLITLVNDVLTRLKPARVADHLMAFTCRRLRRSFRRGGCNVVATLPVNVDPKTSLSLTSSIHCKNRPTKRCPALTLSPSEQFNLPFDALRWVSLRCAMLL